MPIGSAGLYGSPLGSGLFSSNSSGANVSQNRDIVVIGMGQSLIANWSKSVGATGWNNEGQNAFLKVLGEGSSSSNNTFVNAGNGASYLLKSAYTAANTRLGGTLEANDFWVNDDSGFAAGQRLLDAFTLLSNARRLPVEVLYVLWSQGEADQVEIASNNVTAAQYQNALIWLKDYMFTNCTSLRRFMIRPLGRRSYGGAAGDSTANDVIRLIQQGMQTTYPTQVWYGSETYDLPMMDETGATDTVHRSPAGFAIEGARAAREILKLEGLFTGNTKGAFISSIANPSATTITVTVTQDVATSLANRAGTSYTGTPITITPNVSLAKPFRLFSLDGSEITISTVQITGVNQITLTTSVNLYDAGYLLRYAFNSMANIYVVIDRDAIVFDNNPVNPLPLKASYSGVITSSLPATTSSVERFDTLVLSTNLTGSGSFSSTITGATMIVGAGISVPDNNGSLRALRGRLSSTATTATITRATTVTNDAGLPDVTWKLQAVQLPSSICDFHYTIPVTIATGTTSTTITLPLAVDPTRSFIWMEEDCNLQTNSSTAGNAQAYLSPLGAGTQITLNAPVNAIGTIIASVHVVQLKAAAVQAIQEFSIDIPAATISATATLASVTTTNAAIFPMGQAQASGAVVTNPALRQVRVTETSSTVITATKNTAASSPAVAVRGVRVELKAGNWTVQKGQIANVISTNAATPLAVTNVASAKSFILRNGFSTSGTSATSEGDYTGFIFPTISAPNITQLNFTRGSTSANVTTYDWNLVTLP